MQLSLELRAKVRREVIDLMMEDWLAHSLGMQQSRLDDWFLTWK